jgi:hypothetical protein
MANVKRPYGKDSPERFIDGALDGDKAGLTAPDGYQDTMTSNEMLKYPVDRKDQHILTSFAMDNVGEVYGRYPTSMRDMAGIAGGTKNLKHSLTGASVVDEDVGAAGKVVHHIIPNH